MMRVLLAYATPEYQVEESFEVEESCTAALAIQRSGFLARFPELSFSHMQIGIYGKRVPLDASLSPDDRIEIYRPLKIDPKEARRQRV